MRRIGTMNIKEILQHRHGLGLTRAQTASAVGVRRRYDIARFFTERMVLAPLPATPSRHPSRTPRPPARMHFTVTGETVRRLVPATGCGKRQLAPRSSEHPIPGLGPTAHGFRPAGDPDRVVSPILVRGRLS